MFIGVHMPSYLKDYGLAPQVASISLALVGLFNIVGTYVAGNLGQRLPKRYLLSTIYFTRSVRSEEHTSELQSHLNLVCRLLLEKKKKNILIKILNWWELI